jgi:hypothetical protein
MACLNYYLDISLEGLSKTTEIAIRIVNVLAENKPEHFLESVVLTLPRPLSK